MDKYKQTNRQAQDNIYQLIPPQGTSDIARGMGPTNKLKSTIIKKII